MLYRCFVVVTLLAACGGQSTAPSITTPAPAPIGDPAGVARVTEAGQALTICDAGCMEARVAQCTDGGSTWRFTLALGGQAIGDLLVSDRGLIRVDALGKSLRGVDAKLWQACMPSCLGDGGPACVPYLFPIELSWEADCAPTVTAGSDWYGHATQITTFGCAEVPMELTVVPDLLAVRDALVEVGVIAADDGLAKVDGLTVDARMGEQSLFGLGEVTDGSCAAFDAPDGHRRFDQLADFDAFFAIQPGLHRNFEAAGQTLVAQMIEQAKQDAGPQILESLGELCLGKRDHYEPAEVQSCLQANPDRSGAAEALVKALIEPMIAQVIGAADVAQRLLAEHIDQPLCEHFAAR